MTSFVAQLVDPSKAPSRYVKVVKKGNKKDFGFDDATTMVGGSMLNQLLSAYSPTAEAK
jgi:hypothetical protein